MAIKSECFGIKIGQSHGRFPGETDDVPLDPAVFVRPFLDAFKKGVVDPKILFFIGNMMNIDK